MTSKNRRFNRLFQHLRVKNSGRLIKHSYRTLPVPDSYACLHAARDRVRGGKETGAPFRRLSRKGPGLARPRGRDTASRSPWQWPHSLSPHPSQLTQAPACYPPSIPGPDAPSLSTAPTPALVRPIPASLFACCAPYCLLCLPGACMQCLHVRFPGPRFAGDLSR